MLKNLLTYRFGLLLGSILTWTVVFCVPLAAGLANKAVFDTLTGDTSSAPGLWILIAILVTIAIVDPLTMLLWFWVHATFEPHIEALARTNLFRWVLRYSGRKGSAPAPATLVGHMRDDVVGHTDLVNEWYRLSGEGMFVIVAGVIMMQIDVLVTLSAFLPLALVVLVTHRLRGRLAPIWGAAREQTTKVGNVIGDIFGGVQAIKVGGGEHAVTRRFEEVNEERRRAEVRSMMATARLDVASICTVIVGRGLVLIVGAAAIREGRFTVGDFVLFVTYLDFMLMLPRRVGRLLGQRMQSRKALERLGGVMGEDNLPELVRHRPVYLTGPMPPQPGDAGQATALDELRIEGLTFRHPTTGRGIEDIDLTLRKGTITAVVGEIGSGKSTLLDVVLGLRPADSGVIKWNGDPVADPAEFFVPPRAAYKPQVPRLFNLTLRENVLLGTEESGLNEALRQADLDTDVAALADGEDTVVGSRGVRLSGGQVQRTAAARMLVRRPQLYVIDDLSSALDAQTERLVWQRLDADRTETSATYLVVSHRLAVLERADQIAVLRDGRLVACGRLDEVRDRGLLPDQERVEEMSE